MKTTYFVQLMTNEDYDAYLRGSYFYCVKEVTIDADNMEDAIAQAKAMYPTMVVNDHADTLEYRELQKAKAEDKRKKEEAKRERKIANEKAKAEAMGMTEEEYKKEVNKKRNLRRAEREVERLEAELLEAKKKLKYLRERA